MKRLLPLVLCMPLVFGAQEKDPIITPCTAFKGASDVHSIVDVDYLLWYVEQDGMAYALTGYDPSILSSSAGKTLNPNSRWNSGFKVSLGLTLGYDGWDLLSEYTWISNGNVSGSMLSPNLYPTWNCANNYTHFTASPGGLGSIKKADYTFNMQFNILDLEMGRGFFISPYLKMRPHLGLKGAWQKNQFQVTYTRIVSSSVDDEDRMISHQNYSAVGLRTGLDTAWQFTPMWSLYGDVAYSLLWNHFTLSRKDTDTNLSTGVVNTVFQTKNTVYTLKPVLEMGMGIRCESNLCDDAYHILIQLGWEQQWWYAMNQHFSVYNEANQGDLTLQGLTVKVRMDF